MKNFQTYIYIALKPENTLYLMSTKHISIWIGFNNDSIIKIQGCMLFFLLFSFSNINSTSTAVCAMIMNEFWESFMEYLMVDFFLGHSKSPF